MARDSISGWKDAGRQIARDYGRERGVLGPFKFLFKVVRLATHYRPHRRWLATTGKSSESIGE